MLTAHKIYKYSWYIKKYLKLNIKYSFFSYKSCLLQYMGIDLGYKNTQYQYNTTYSENSKSTRSYRELHPQIQKWISIPVRPLAPPNTSAPLCYGRALAHCVTGLSLRWDSEKNTFTPQTLRTKIIGYGFCFIVRNDFQPNLLRKK